MNSLEVSNLVLRLRGRILIGPLSFAVAPDRPTTIMGPSGCGKSSLLNWLIGMLPAPFAAQGSVRIGGRALDGPAVAFELRPAGGVDDLGEVADEAFGFVRRPVDGPPGRRGKEQPGAQPEPHDHLKIQCTTRLDLDSDGGLLLKWVCSTHWDVV